MFVLKNAVVYNLIKRRKDRKVKNLKQILEEYIKKKNKLQKAKRQRKKELASLTLEKRLEKLKDDDKILNQDQYERIVELTEGIVKENVEQNFTQLRLLQDNFNTKLMPKGKKKKDNYDGKSNTDRDESEERSIYRSKFSNDKKSRS